MKTIIKTYLLIVAVVLGCFQLLPPKAFGVLPPPDGGYPGGNTAEGQNALFSRTTGGYNTAVGFFSLRNLTEGSFNTATGAGALLSNTGDENTATGAGALLSNITGARNTANGAFALFSNTEGVINTATGDQALFSNTTGAGNTADGAFALLSNTTGVSNTATGNQALYSNTTGNFNTANGFGALASNTTGSQNTVFGDDALVSSTTGADNTATGFRALFHNATGNFNTANGLEALFNNTIGTSNTAVGVNAGAGVTTANDVICIGADVDGENVSNTCYIGNIFGVTSVGIGVLVNSAGKLGTTTSSRRFKDGIKPMDQSSEALFALKPVTFHYKKGIDPQGLSQFGLVAEDVEVVDRNLVVRDEEGKPYSVRYDAVNAMLLNEFLKEHRKVEQQHRKIQGQEATIAQLQSRMDALVAHIKGQDSKIQKVTDQLEMSKAVPQVATIK